MKPESLEADAVLFGTDRRGKKLMRLIRRTPTEMLLTELKRLSGCQLIETPAGVRNPLVGACIRRELYRREHLHTAWELRRARRLANLGPDG